MSVLIQTLPKSVKWCAPFQTLNSSVSTSPIQLWSWGNWSDWSVKQSVDRKLKVEAKTICWFTRLHLQRCNRIYLYTFQKLKCTVRSAKDREILLKYIDSCLSWDSLKYCKNVFSFNVLLKKEEILSPLPSVNHEEYCSCHILFTMTWNLQIWVTAVTSCFYIKNKLIKLTDIILLQVLRNMSWLKRQLIDVRSLPTDMCCWSCVHMQFIIQLLIIPNFNCVQNLLHYIWNTILSIPLWRLAL